MRREYYDRELTTYYYTENKEKKGRQSGLIFKSRDRQQEKDAWKEEEESRYEL